jgi:23S rRNA (cytosine1962-C5)-methyltransferase
VVGTRSFSTSRQRRIADAVQRREPLFGHRDLTAYRLLHDAADGTHGLAIDRYSGVLIVHADSEAVLEGWREPLREAFGAYRSAFAKIHPSHASRATLETQRLWGRPCDAATVLENGARFEIRTGAGLNVGLFLDMREVRTWLRSIAEGRRVLNLFAYTCGFGVAAMLGGASRVLNLDLSRNYLEWGQINYRLNDLRVDTRDFVYGDAFDWLTRFARRSETFDVVIVDPPSFSSSRTGTFAVERDYSRLATAAARVVAPGGILLSATNHAGMPDAHFDAMLRTAVDAAARPHRTERRWHEPSPDFPVAVGGTPYLKVRALVLE